MLHELAPALPQSSDFDELTIALVVFLLICFVVAITAPKRITRRRIERVNKRLARDFPALQQNYNRRRP